MEQVSNFIRVSSQKGGVGKSVISVNLAIAISSLDRKVLLVDEDLTNPSVGVHLGIEDDVTVGIKSVLDGTTTIDKVIRKYFPSGFDVLPGVVSEGQLDPRLTDAQVDSLWVPLRKTDYDVVIFDTSPGMISERVLTYYDEILVVTTPDMPSINSTIRILDEYKKRSVKNEFVINRVTGEKHELHVAEIEGIMKQFALGVLPEDPGVPLSISKQIPIYINDNKSPFSREVAKLALHYAYHL